MTMLGTRRDIDLRADQRSSKDLVVTNYEEFHRLDSVQFGTDLKETIDAFTSLLSGRDN
jgi:hypothetical protein